MSSRVISLRDATVRFDGSTRPALDRVSLDIRPGSWTAVVGANGSGKSTLLAALAGLVPLSGGTLERDGAPRVALLQQDADNQLVATSVRNELALSVAGNGTDRRRIDAAVERFDLTSLLERNPHRLSGGEKQRLACATVWLEEPDVLLLDEPLAFLDADARTLVMDFVRESNARGAAVVWATPGDDAAFAREVVRLEEGRRVARAPDLPPRPPAARVPRARGDVLLRARGVSFAYPGHAVLDSVDLEVARGESVGILGRNSAGKSTLLLVLGGALAPASGRIVRERGGDDTVLYLPQSPERMFFAESVRQEIAFGVERRRRVDRDQLENVVQESLRAVGLDPADVIDRSPFQLSFGEMRRVAFAVAHAMAPALLLLDEPASCLDAEGRDVLAALVAARSAATGAVIVASHDARHLDGFCDRSAELRNGKLSA